MILVTVGTAGPFDELLREVDHLASVEFFKEPVLCQSGQSRYRMLHCEQFVGRPTIADLIEQSSLVITHGGTTVIQLLVARKPFVAFPNKRLAGDHQTKFLQAVAQAADISWSRDVGDLARLYKARQALGPAHLPANLPRARTVILGSLGIAAAAAAGGQSTSTGAADV
jgi:UDP-N-acetylglucosamine transferase subunit ALG13